MNEFIKMVTDNGMTIVLAVVWILTSIQQSKREAVRSDRLEQSIAPALAAVAVALKESTVKKDELSRLMKDYQSSLDKNTIAIENILLLYQRSVERVDREISTEEHMVEQMNAYRVNVEEALELLKALQLEMKALRGE